MGRLAYSRIDSNLDLTRYWKRLSDLPCPFDVAAYFERSAPVELEIGSGKGWFLTQAAVANPHHNFVGIEYARKYSRFAASRLASEELKNALMIDGDGLQFFREFIPSASADRVHVYFPDPWWKQRHRKRRILNEAFLADVQRVLRPGGRLVFWTDVKEYFDATVRLIATATDFGPPIPVPEPAENDFRTHFERRTRLHNEAVYRVEFEK